MSHASCATMSLRGSRPCLSRSRFVRHPGFTIRVQPRLFQVERLRAKGPDDFSKPGCGEGDGHRSMQSCRGRDRLTPDARFRRMGDYFDSMQRDLETVIDMFGAPSGLLRRFPLSRALDLESPIRGALRNFGFDVHEDEKEYRIQADVPGFSKDNVKVTLSDDGILSIEGHETYDSTEDASDSEGKEDTGATAPRTKRSRDFVRKLRLPDNAQQEGITASVENGVLSITIPKVEKAGAEPKEIPVN